MKLSQKLSDFDAETKVSIPYLAANASRLKVDPTQVTDSGNLNTDWMAKYGIYSNPTTHTPQSVIDINNAYKVFHPYMSGINQQIKNNKSVTLTGEDITALHIHVDQPHRNHIPAPNFAPVNTVIKTTHLVNRIFTSNPNPPHQDETAMPADVNKITRKLAVTAAGAPAPTPEQYHPLEDIGSTQYDLVFSPEQVSGSAYLITRYANARGEQGPPSTPLMFTII